MAFVAELSERLHADGRTLTVSVPPVYDARRTRRSGYWVYDYGAIAPLVDSIRVMAYDYSNASTDPGAIAPLDWVSADRRRHDGSGGRSVQARPRRPAVRLQLADGAKSGDCPDDGTPGVTTVTSRTVDALAQRTRRDARPRSGDRRVVVHLRARRRRRVHADAGR